MRSTDHSLCCVDHRWHLVDEGAETILNVTDKQRGLARQQPAEPCNRHRNCRLVCGPVGRRALIGLRSPMSISYHNMMTLLLLIISFNVQVVSVC